MHVVVVGGGVGGLSAAHELAERGVRVTVLERGSVPGGKARSVDVASSGGDGRAPLPGEHGFRFFGHFYRHLPDTMRRIPFPGSADGVAGNLVDLPRGFIARPGLPPIETDTQLPRSLSDLKVALRLVFGDRGGLSDADIEFFAGKLWRLLTSCWDRRLGEYERVPWGEFIDAGGRSETYRAWFVGLTRTFVAAAGNLASARTMGDILVQLLLSNVHRNGDRVLNGPTNEVWIRPWLEHLATLGVDYRLESPVEQIRYADGRVAGVVVDGGSGSAVVEADAYIAAVPVDRMAALLTDDLLDKDPSLAMIRALATHQRWMNGIQLYLTEDVPIVQGHTLYVGVPWGLTSISQQQFWPKVQLADRGDGRVRGVISVDICDWDTPGLLEHRGAKRPARECTFDEIRDDVWAQLKACLNVDGKTVLRDEILHSAFLDPDIVLATGAAPATNAEPMLVNDAGTWSLRPTAYTQIPNLYLASDYVQTYTDLATMEGANEAARRAVNAILEASGRSRSRCRIWNLHEPRVLAAWRAFDALRYRKGLPWRSPPIVPGRLVHAVDRALHRIRER